MNWRKCFNKGIVERGEDYYRSGMVDDLAYDAVGDFYTQVHGKNDYNVRVRLNADREIRDFECDCPYFLEGNNCKHIAAVLLKWEDAQGSTKRKTKRTKLRTIPELRQEITKLRWACSGSNSHVEYWQAYEFLQKMLSFLENDIDNFLEHTQITEAFKLTNILLENFLTTNIEDNKEADEFCLRIFEAWQKIYQVADEAFHQIMLEWFAKQLQEISPEAANADLAIDSILDFWSDYFESPSFYTQKLAVIDAKIAKTEQSDDATRSFELERWLSAKVELIKKHHSYDEIENFYLENWQYDYLKRSYVDWLMQQEKHEEALQAINQILETEEVYDFDRIYYYNQLSFIYGRQGNNVLRRNCLMELIQMGDKVSEHFYSIKTLYSSEEWQEVCRKIIRQIPTAQERAALYCREKLYQELYNEVAQDQSRMLLQSYSNFLSKKFPEEIVAMYEDLLNEEVMASTGREHYRKLASLLRRLKRLPGGETTVQKLLNDWQTQYKNRRAMMEELEKVR